MPRTPSISLITDRILVIRGERIMLDSDLAELYGVTTRQLNQQVARNPERFPTRLMFRLNTGEWQKMYPQIVGTSQTRRRLDR